MDTTVDTLQPAAPRSRRSSDRPREVAETTDAPAASRKARRLTFAGIGALVLAAAGVSAFVYYGGRVSTDDAQVDAHIAPVAPKVSGNIAEVLVDDNQTVKAGQVLLLVHPRHSVQRVAQHQAALDAAESKAARATRPDVDVAGSWTRREDLLVVADELERRQRWRASVAGDPLLQADALADLFRPAPLDTGSRAGQ